MAGEGGREVALIRKRSCRFVTSRCDGGGGKDSISKQFMKQLPPWPAAIILPSAFPTHSLGETMMGRVETGTTSSSSVVKELEMAESILHPPRSPFYCRRRLRRRQVNFSRQC